MSVFQKIILALGAALFVLIMAVYPPKYLEVSQGKSFLYPDTSMRYAFVDVGATSFRGVSVLVATATLWAIAGKKKTE